MGNFIGKAKHIRNRVLDELVELNDTEVTVVIKKVNKKRSLDANAYCWVLIDKIAEKMHINKSDVYRNAIKEIGGVSTTVCVVDKAVDELCEKWQEKGTGWQAEAVKSKIDGCTNVTLYYGSSTYDSKQMSGLIDKIVQDAKAIGIDTRTHDEIAQMMSLWEQKG